MAHKWIAQLKEQDHGLLGDKRMLLKLQSQMKKKLFQTKTVLKLFLNYLTLFFKV